MSMNTAVVSSDSSASWFKPQHWWACLRGRLRTAFKPRVIFVHAGQSTSEQGWSGVAQSFADWCAEHVGENCMVGLSSRWLLNGLVDAELGPQAAVEQVVQQWSHYMDVDAASLQTGWVLRQVSIGELRLVSAAPSALIEALLDVAKVHGVRLVWAGPWWARGAQSWLRGMGQQPDAPEAASMLMAQEPGLVTHIEASFATGQPGRLQRIWVEVANGESPASSGTSVKLVSPQQVGIERQPHHAYIWDQDQLVPVLQGEPADWGVNP
jgi:hypothetical protein